MGGVPYCTPEVNKTNCKPPNTVCDTNHIDACCPPENPVCMKFSSLLSGNFETAVCGKNQCGLGETTCPEDADSNPFDNGFLCCRSDETCGIPPGELGLSYPLPICYANCDSVKPGYHCCKGKDDFASTARWCRVGIEQCGWSNGIPICVPAGEELEETSEISSISLFVVRDKESFSLNGKAYVIRPHINFSNPATLIVNHSYYQGADVKTFKYKDHEAVLDSCDKILITSISKNIGLEGGIINIEDKISLDIPENALQENYLIINQNCFKTLKM